MENTAKTISATDAVPRLVDLLSNLNPVERQRALSAALILLGDQLTAQQQTARNAQLDGAAEGISHRAQMWMRKHSITGAQLEHVFSISPEGVDVIASRMPADSKRQQTVEGYLICGIADLLRTGEGKFLDADARELCRKVGCYDRPNHTNYMKASGNLLSGNKDTGWRLTNPGFERAAKVIQQLVPQNT